MDKLKGFNTLKLQKFIIIILVLVFFTGTIGSFLEFLKDLSFGPDLLLEQAYFQSQDYGHFVNDILRSLDSLIMEYRNEDYIMHEKDISMDNSNYIYDDFRLDMEALYEDFHYSDRYDIDKTEEENEKKFLETYAEEIKALEENEKNKLLRDMDREKKFLEGHEGLTYYATNGKDVFTNASSENVKAKDFDKFEASVLIDGEEGFRTKPEDSRYVSYYNFKQIKNTDKKIYIGFDEEYLNPMASKWHENKEIAIDDFQQVLVFGAGLIISFIGLLFITGRTNDEGIKVQMRFIDWVFTDINIIICMAIIFSWFLTMQVLDSAGLIDIISISNRDEIFMEPLTKNPVFLITTFLLGGLGLSFVLSLVRHIKNRTFFKHSLVGRVFLKIFNFLKEIHRSSSVGKKIIGGLIIYPLALALTILIFPLTMTVFIWFALKKVREFEAIKEGVKEIKSGDLDYQIEIEKDGEFKKLADDINDIGHGLKSAIDNELKSERHKAELITNVSHDIRTPLTSIITYIDLLKQEDDEDKKKEYIGVLDQKSDRLKKLIDDLFEASKVSSGNIPVNLTRIDIASIMTQGLGELNSDIEKNDLDFRIYSQEEEMYVKADGDLLWRAIENLLSNIFKYGLKGSRVYVDIEERDHMVDLTIKNISAYELNITEEELMERFKRGDESRTSEGSGLGLSIAESLVDLQKGKFTIEIDGDLFKTRISLPKCDK